MGILKPQKNASAIDLPGFKTKFFYFNLALKNQAGQYEHKHIPNLMDSSCKIAAEVYLKN